MPSIRVPKDEKDSIFFITCTTQRWYHIFDRHNRWQILADSLMHCQKQKGLKLFAYVFMLNHIHLLGTAPDMSRVLCDFKKFTSKELMKNILSYEPSIAELFPEKDGKRKLWQETNFPQRIDSEEIFLQKYHYIHLNPVRKQYVEQPEHWFWSSANPNQPILISSAWDD